MVQTCPICNSSVDSAPIACSVCGYRSDLAREYLWLYAGGIVFAGIGFLLGILGVFSEGRSPQHWTSITAGWFPLWPWPAGYHWLAFLVAGIVFTVGGLGLTRHRRFAWVGLAVFLFYEFGLVLAAGSGILTAPEAGHLPWVLAGVAATLFALLLRVGIALYRTPRRDVSDLQERARQNSNRAVLQPGNLPGEANPEFSDRPAAGDRTATVKRPMAANGPETAKNPGASP